MGRSSTYSNFYYCCNLCSIHAANVSDKTLQFPCYKYIYVWCLLCIINAQYTPPTPMRLNCRVESRRRCVLNSRLVGDSLDESEHLPTTKSSCVVSAVWTHQSSVVTQFPIFCASHELSWVGAASRRRCVLNSQLAHDDCRRLTTKIWKLNMLGIYPVELSGFELSRRCIHARRLSWPSLQRVIVCM